MFKQIFILIGLVAGPAFAVDWVELRSLSSQLTSQDESARERAYEKLRSEIETIPRGNWGRNGEANLLFVELILSGLRHHSPYATDLAVHLLKSRRVTPLTWRDSDVQMRLVNQLAPGAPYSSPREKEVLRRLILEDVFNDQTQRARLALALGKIDDRVLRGAVITALERAEVVRTTGRHGSFPANEVEKALGDPSTPYLARRVLEQTDREWQEASRRHHRQVNEAIKRNQPSRFRAVRLAGAIGSGCTLPFRKIGVGRNLATAIAAMTVLPVVGAVAGVHVLDARRMEGVAETMSKDLAAHEPTKQDFLNAAVLMRRAYEKDFDRSPYLPGGATISGWDAGMFRRMAVLMGEDFDRAARRAGVDDDLLEMGAKELGPRWNGYVDRGGQKDALVAELLEWSYRRMKLPATQETDPAGRRRVTSSTMPRLVEALGHMGYQWDVVKQPPKPLETLGTHEALEKEMGVFVRERLFDRMGAQNENSSLNHILIDYDEFTDGEVSQQIEKLGLAHMPWEYSNRDILFNWLYENASHRDRAQFGKLLAYLSRWQLDRLSANAKTQGKQGYLDSYKEFKPANVDDLVDYLAHRREFNERTVFPLLSSYGSEKDVAAALGRYFSEADLSGKPDYNRISTRAIFLASVEDPAIQAMFQPLGLTPKIDSPEFVAGLEKLASTPTGRKSLKPIQDAALSALAKHVVANPKWKGLPPGEAIWKWADGEPLDPSDAWISLSGFNGVPRAYRAVKPVNFAELGITINKDDLLKPASESETGKAVRKYLLHSGAAVGDLPALPVAAFPGSSVDSKLIGGRGDQYLLVDIHAGARTIDLLGELGRILPALDAAKQGVHDWRPRKDAILSVLEIAERYGVVLPPLERLESYHLTAMEYQVSGKDDETTMSR